MPAKLIKRRWKTDILSIACLFLLFYMMWLGSYPFFTPDEGRYSEVAREMVMTGDLITPRVNGIPFLDKPVLFYWLQAISISLFGVSEWAVRLFPVLIGCFGCIITYICGRRLFNRRAALLSAAILATSPLYFVGAHYANMDLEVAVWISAALLCTITAIQAEGIDRKKFMYAAYFFSGLAFLTKGLIGIVFPVAVTGLWMLIMWRWDLLSKIYLWVGLAILFLMTFPWYFAALDANHQFFQYFFITQQFSRFLSEGDFNNKTAFWFYIPVMIVGFFPWVIFLPAAIVRAIKNIRQAKTRFGTIIFLLLWLVVVTIFFSIPRSKIITYILPAFPVLALFTGQYITQIWETSNRARMYALNMSMVLFSLLAGLALITFPHHLQFEPVQHARNLLTAFSIILFSAATLLVVFLQRIDVRRLFILCTMMSVIALLFLVSNAGKLNSSSAKPLVAILKENMAPQDDVVNYYKFYQDVPLYLGRKVQLVADWHSPDIASRDNWVREMWLGKDAIGAYRILIHEDYFWKQWRGSNRVFVFVNDNYLEQFKQRAGEYFVIGKGNDIFLVSNKVD